MKKGKEKKITHTEEKQPLEDGWIDERRRNKMKETVLMRRLCFVTKTGRLISALDH